MSGVKAFQVEARHMQAAAVAGAHLEMGRKQAGAGVTGERLIR